MNSLLRFQPSKFQSTELQVWSKSSDLPQSTNTHSSNHPLPQSTKNPSNFPQATNTPSHFQVCTQAASKLKRYAILSETTPHKSLVNGKKQDLDIIKLGDAFESISAHAVLEFVVFGTFVCIFMVGASMPVLSFTPDGLYDSRGMLYFISDGFEKHSAAASVIYGTGTLFIGISRVLAIIVYIPGKNKALLCCFLLLISQVGGILTTRNDQIKDIHLIAALAWIASSLAFHALVIAFNGTYSSVNGGGKAAKVIWSISTATGTVFLVMMVTNKVQEGTSIRFWTGMCEFTCAELILANDFVMTLSLYIRYVLNSHVSEKIPNAPDLLKT